MEKIKSIETKKGRAIIYRYNNNNKNNSEQEFVFKIYKQNYLQQTFTNISYKKALELFDIYEMELK